MQQFPVNVKYFTDFSINSWVLEAYEVYEANGTYEVYEAYEANGSYEAYGPQKKLPRRGRNLVLGTTGLRQCTVEAQTVARRSLILGKTKLGRANACARACVHTRTCACIIYIKVKWTRSDISGSTSTGTLTLTITVFPVGHKEWVFPVFV